MLYGNGTIYPDIVNFNSLSIVFFQLIHAHKMYKTQNPNILQWYKNIPLIKKCTINTLNDYASRGICNCITSHRSYISRWIFPSQDLRQSYIYCMLSSYFEIIISNDPVYFMFSCLWGRILAGQYFLSVCGTGFSQVMFCSGDQYNSYPVLWWFNEMYYV